MTIEAYFEQFIGDTYEDVIPTYNTYITCDHYGKWDRDIDGFTLRFYALRDAVKHLESTTEGNGCVYGYNGDIYGREYVGSVSSPGVYTHDLKRLMAASEVALYAPVAN